LTIAWDASYWGWQPIKGVAFTHEPRNKRDVMAVLKQNLRLSADEDAERSYNSLRLVTTLDVAPDPEAW